MPYSYGQNVYYEEGDVYYGENAVATEEEYALQAQTLASQAPEVTEASVAEVDQNDWLQLGVFTVTADGEASGPPPSMFFQLAVSKDGVIAGTYHNTDADQTAPIEGAVDLKTQRTAWGISGRDWPIMETGLANLTEETGPALLHFADGQTQQWLLVRVDEPESTP